MGIETVTTPPTLAGEIWTVDVTGVPIHPLVVGVIVYTTVCNIVVVLVNMFEILKVFPAPINPEVADDGPITLTVLSRVQLYVVAELTELETAIGEFATPEQMVCKAVFNDATGFGFTLVTKVKVFPVQVPERLAMLNVAVCAMFVGLVNVCAIDDSVVPLVNPVSPPVTIGKPQEYCVPEGTIFPLPFAGEMLIVSPLQMVVVRFVTDGLGFTVTVRINVAPGQVTEIPETGVTV